MKSGVKKTHYFKRLLPKTKADWKLYFIKTLPIIIGEILFCLNGFLDNFMVSQSAGGIDALTYANTYTGIMYTIFFAIQGIAAMFVGQYYGRKDYDKVNQIMNIRIWMYMIIVMFFAIPAWTVGPQMINLVATSGIEDSTRIEASKYLTLIAISWAITSFNFNTNMQLNETGHSNLAMVSATATVVVNGVINAICLYVFKMPPHAAAFGSIIGALVCLTSDQILTYWKDRPIYIDLFRIYYIKKPIAKQILKRLPAMGITILGMITIPLRMMIWTRAYPGAAEGSGIGQPWMDINGVTVLGLVESLSSIASAVTSVCSSNVSYFVATRLGENRFEEAEQHAYSLRGFHALAGAMMSVIMIGVVFGIAYSGSTTKGLEDGVENKINELIKNNSSEISSIKNYLGLSSNADNKELIAAARLAASNEFRRVFLLCCGTFILFNPVWCWFYTSAALPRAGGRNNIASVTMLSVQWLSFIWLIIIVFGIVRPLKAQDTFIPLELAYFLFYSIDLIRWGIFEIVAWKTNWLKNVTVKVDGEIDGELPAVAAANNCSIHTNNEQAIN
ncbi:MATE family efflux transporter [[Mycoplasma] falconis]|uniref:MATE family efflux transporter n=1 Tax=[Mycoplasma] falconis TaxID=92403 RepID=A0A501XBT3_9BACT|nr:MATE family efflux transporter [[Mycoplasma] falconis]TPE57754.1 MATE family efflux transporter [[Mycoplasma] falconis]